MVPWNSFPLEIIYQLFGWLAFLSWSLAGYPQLISNFRRKSVVGLSLDYTILNFTKHWSYLIYNASLFFSPVIQKQYFEKYGYRQALMNFMRKSTDGFSIGSILLDFSGGVFNYSQMVVQSIDQDSWVNFYGNIGKVMISLMNVIFRFQDVSEIVNDGVTTLEAYTDDVQKAAHKDQRKKYGKEAHGMRLKQRNSEREKVDEHALQARFIKKYGKVKAKYGNNLANDEKSSKNSRNHYDSIKKGTGNKYYGKIVDMKALQCYNYQGFGHYA
ncbi:hypothetical protein KIW84_012139 [Lathyrus oleraceus]|uniref:Uncharacterized protein n=1 Tax=Pisum sativum TaxID=3888 RepID=A0A9D5BGQ9_PEA|nr:hypothetical protein KIW84_012139 [Pisum sativum]